MPFVAGIMDETLDIAGYTRSLRSAADRQHRVSVKRDRHTRKIFMASHCTPVGLLSFGKGKGVLRKQRKSY